MSKINEVMTATEAADRQGNSPPGLLRLQESTAEIYCRGNQTVRFNMADYGGRYAESLRGT